jgi:hypothetical protein
MINLTINFTSTYVPGTYRLCWRVSTLPDPYVCVPVLCTPSIGACSVVIPTGLTPVGCDIIKFDGYLQPTCQPEGSESNRALFDVEYNPCP